MHVKQKLLRSSCPLHSATANKLVSIASPVYYIAVALT